MSGLPNDSLRTYMPKVAKELTPIEIKRITKPGHHAVGGVPGLLLQVTESKSGNNAKSWILRTYVGIKRRDIGLGGYPAIPLSTAREKARAAKELISQGTDPIEHKKSIRARLIASQAIALTFDEAAEKLYRSKSKEFRNAKHSAQWINSIKTYASPIIGKLSVAEVELVHIVKILEPIWLSKTETASRLRGRIESVISWATVSGFRKGDNPARWQGHLDTVLPKPSKVSKVTHYKALGMDDMFSFMADLRKRDGIAARALEFAILTATRSGEIRGATWDEIDLQKRIWIIPSGRMKAQKEHRVPLSVAAIKVLSTIPRFNDNNLLFPSPRGCYLSENSLPAVIKRMGINAVPHGFRSTFRDWCAERTNYPRDVAEMALAHSIGNAVEAAYRRGDLFAKRTKLMQEWANFLIKSPAQGSVPSIMELHKT